MTWTLTNDVDAYAATVTPLLSSQPERYTVLMTVLAGLAEHGPDLYGGEPPVFGWWSRDGAVRAAVLQTPPYPVLVTDLPADAVGPLAAALTPGHAAGITQVLGAEPDATAFARAWAERTGQGFGVEKRQRLYRLGELTPPDPMPNGASRVATPTDLVLASAVNEAFGAEIGQRPGTSVYVESRVRAGRLVLWELAGEMVSTACITAAISGVARVADVYTPPEHRNHGYGAAVTAAATRLALDRGAESVILFTDLANPTSNALYPRLGYRPVEDKVVLAFGPGEGRQG